MSTQREEPVANGPSPDHEVHAGRGRAFVGSLRVLAAVSALVSLLALWSVESRQLSHDLQLAADVRARPGDRIALRALIFRDVDAPTGAELATAATRVRLLDARGTELAAVSLTASAASTLDGTLLLPPGQTGSFVLEAHAVFQGEDLWCRRLLEIDSQAQRTPAHGREAGPLQHFSLGPVRARGGVAPAQLLPRVVGGACLPGETCRVLVWVGEPAALLRARTDAGAELLGPASPALETSGIVELRVRVQGPDAQLTLEAHRAGALVAERALRLPVGLGEVGLSAQDALVEPNGLRVDFVPPPGRAQLTFDSFADTHWSGIAVLPSARTPRRYQVPPEFAALGVFRLQARADLLSAEGAGAQLFYVRAPGESDAAALTRLAAQASELAGMESVSSWTRALPTFASDDPQRAAAFLLASLAQQRLPVPLPASGRPAQLARLSHTRALFRFGVAGALVLSSLVMALSVARRGLVAADQAQSILDLARGEGDNEASAPLPGEVFGARLRVILLALAVAAAFLAAALLIAAKPLWF